jgi:hypothetical protein
MELLEQPTQAVVAVVLEHQVNALAAQVVQV